MRPYLAEIAINLKLTLRDKTVLVFNYAFPLIFFFIFSSLFRAEQGGASAQVVAMVIVIGILGNGFFGAGIRSVAEREANILRRFKVAPISAAPLLVSSLVTGWLNYLPSALLIILLSHFFYALPWPSRPFSLFLYISLGVLAFRAIGLIIASVVNSMQESQVVIQLLYFPMLFLSGATIPITALPPWLQEVTVFIPAKHLFDGVQAIMGAGETIGQNWKGALALLTAAVLATFLGVKLFRWEKDEKISASGKLWLVAVLGPFLILGAIEVHTHEGIAKSKVLARQLARSRSLFIRNARIFIGNGEVLSIGSVLVRNGRIAEVYPGTTAPDASQLKAEVIEAAGKTLLPGLIDVHVHLASPGGVYASPKDYELTRNIPHELAAYLYSGVTAVKSAGDPLDPVLKMRTLANSGERLVAELFVCGPMFTAPGGHGTEYVKFLPEALRDKAQAQLVRLPKSPAEARQMVDALKQRGVDGVKAILETGTAGMLFNRMDPRILDAVVAEAHADGLAVVVHTGDSRDVADALAAGADGIEHGSFRQIVSDALFARMKAQNTTYDPTLAVVDAGAAMENGSTEPLDRPMVLQVGPGNLLDATRKMIRAAAKAPAPGEDASLRIAGANLLRAFHAGVMLVTGTDSGNPGLVHGPAIHRELQLWVAAGIPPAVALQAATYNAARLLHADSRFGIIAKGREADLLIVDGDPLTDIRQTESIQQIIFQGERVDRSELFNEE